ncbi:unnamed protein product [Cutaneotrichosporon oleaginosum]
MADQVPEGVEVGKWKGHRDAGHEEDEKQHQIVGQGEVRDMPITCRSGTGGTLKFSLFDDRATTADRRAES